MVARDQGQIGVLDDALHGPFGGSLEGGIHFFAGGAAGHFQHHVHHRHVGGRNAHGDAVQLALHRGVNQGNGLGRTGGGGHDVDGGRPGPTQVAVAGVENPLVTRIAVGGGHRAFDDAEGLVQHLDDRRHAVGGAAGVAEDVEIFIAVLVGVDANHEGAHTGALTRGREDHFLRPCFEVLAGAHVIVEDTGGLDHQINAPFLPGQVEGVAVGEALDLPAIHNDRVVRVADFGVANAAEHRVVLEQVGIGPGIGGVIETHHLDTRIGTSAQPATHEVATNSAESIDRNAHGHGKARRKPLAKGDLAADHTETDLANPLAARGFKPDHAGTRSIS